MNRCDEISIVTQDYLDEFNCILNKMIKEMTSAELTNSISYNYIVQMIPHHRAAIEMSQNILKYTTDIPVQNIALAIVEEQTKSIEDMLKIECRCNELRNYPRDLNTYQREINLIMRTMFSEMKGAGSVNQINCNFLWEMIPHHMGAVKMSETALKYPVCRELIPILQSIIESQRQGIRQMKELLDGMHCS